MLLYGAHHSEAKSRFPDHTIIELTTLLLFLVVGAVFLFLPRRDYQTHSSKQSAVAAKIQKQSRAKVALDAPLEASFVESWRETRAMTVKPSGGPPASEPLDALKQRIAARGAVSST